MERLVSDLAALTRDSAGAGERAAALLVRAHLRERGVDGELRPFRYQGTYAAAHALHAVAGLLGGPAALAALASLELEASGRAQWLRRLLPAAEGTNLIARVPARGQRRATVALVAHLDAARTGLVWHPRLVALSTDLARRRTSGFMGLTALGFLLAAPKRTRVLGRALLATSILADLDIARSPTVPGANDNATGVAAVCELLAEGPREGLELVGVFPGCEESGMGGMAAFLRDERPDFVVGLDTLGCGTPIVCAAEGTMLAHRYDPADVALVPEAAERWRIGGWTDPVLARFAGIPAVSILSRGPDGPFTNYHRMSDTPEHVDWESVRQCLSCARGLLERLASRPWGRHAGTS